MAAVHKPPVASQTVKLLNSPPAVIRLTLIMCARFPLSLKNCGPVDKITPKACPPIRRQSGLSATESARRSGNGRTIGLRTYIYPSDDGFALV